MSTITITVPDELSRALRIRPDALGDTLRLAAAVKLHEVGRLSAAAAAQIAGLPRVVFLSKLADYGVDTFDLTEEQLQRQTRLG